MLLPKSTLFMIIFSISASLLAQKTATVKKSPLVIGETVEFQSEILQEKRILNVYLPHGYSKDLKKTYPVVYLLDGSMDEDLIHISGLVQYGAFPWMKMIPESIVVGIANVDRKRDFTHKTDDKKLKKKYPAYGGSEKFIAFIEKEVKPLVEESYQNNSNSTIIGQSLGGLLATEILVKKPQLFDNYIIVSASLWYDNESLVKSDIKTANSVKSVYVAVGKEGKVMERTAKELYEKLNANKSESAKVFFEFFEKNDHADVYHLAVYSAFNKLFKAK